MPRGHKRVKATGTSEAVTLLSDNSTTMIPKIATIEKDTPLTNLFLGN